MLAVIYRPLVIECVDPVFLRTVSRAGAPAHLAFLALVVINLVNGFHALGTLLAVGLMILPAGIARFWSRDITGMICIAVASAIVSGYAGLVLSFQTRVPSGPAIILAAAVLYVVSGVVRQRRRAGEADVSRPPPRSVGWVVKASCLTRLPDATSPRLRGRWRLALAGARRVRGILSICRCRLRRARATPPLPRKRERGLTAVTATPGRLE